MISRENSPNGTEMSDDDEKHDFNRFGNTGF